MREVTRMICNVCDTRWDGEPSDDCPNPECLSADVREWNIGDGEDLSTSIPTKE